MSLQTISLSIQRFTIGRHCVGWEDDSMLVAGGGKKSGAVVYYKAPIGRPRLSDRRPSRAVAGWYWNFKVSRKGGSKYPAVAADGEPLGELLILRALRTGDRLDMAWARAHLRKQLKSRGVACPELDGPVRGEEEFIDFAGRWIAGVVMNGGPEGLRALTAWCEVADRSVEIGNNMKIHDLALWQFLEAAANATADAEGVPTNLAVRKHWEQIMAQGGPNSKKGATLDKFNDLKKRAGFTWLPTRGQNASKRGVISTD